MFNVSSGPLELSRTDVISGGRLIQVILIRINLLGMFQAQRVGAPEAQLESDKVRALLAFLATEHSRPHLRENLASLFWPNSSLPRARRSLSQALYNLRQGLGLPEENPILFTSGREVAFHPDPQVEVDLLNFEALVQECQKHTHRLVSACPECLPRLEQAADLYRGEFLAGLVLEGCEAFESWLVEQRQVSLKKARQVFYWLAEARALTGDLEQARDHAQRLVNLDPLNEQAVRQLMTLSLRSGRRNEALLAYQNLKKQLEVELGVEPDVETSQLYKRIRRAKASAPFTPPNNLLNDLTQFIGRSAELADLHQKLTDPTCRLITLLGPGGIGKTRLASEAARRSLRTFPDGVFILDMELLSSSGIFLPAVANLVGVSIGEHPGEVQKAAGLEARLYEYLAEKEMLLIFDNFESMLDGTAAAIHKLLGRTSRLKLLVTTRSPLNLKSEHLMVVHGLNIPSVAQALEPGDGEPAGEAFSAVQLFLSSAQRANNHFRLTQQNLPAVIRICQVVEGTPLMILLAAAWMSAMTAEEVASQMQSGLDLMEREWHDIPPRHRSLRLTFEQSWNLLEPRLRVAFRRLAVFRQPFTAARAREICQVSEEECLKLQENFMLQAHPPGRLRMHAMLHAFALEKLQDDPAERSSLLDHYSYTYLQMLQAWAPGLKTNRLALTLNEMDGEVENVRKAWGWAQKHGRYSELKEGIVPLGRYYLRRSRFTDGEDLCRLGVEAIQQVGLDVHNLHLWARLMTWKAIFLLNLDRTDESKVVFQQAIAELQKPGWSGLDTRFEQAFAMRRYGILLRYEDNHQALELLQLSLEYYRQVGDAWDVAQGLFNLAKIHEAFGQSLEERRLLEEALDILGPDGDPLLRDNILDFLGLTYLMLGHFESGLPIFRESLNSRLESGDELQIASAQERLVLGLIWSGEYQEAYEVQSQALEIFEEHNAQPASLTQIVRAALSTFLGRYTQAQAQMSLVHEKMYAHLANFLSGAILLAQKRYQGAIPALEESTAACRLIPDHRILALSLACLSLAYYFAKDAPAARQALIDALQTSQQDHMVVGVHSSLAAAAHLLADGGWLEAAVELLAVTRQHPTAANSVLFADIAFNPTRRAAASLPHARRKAAERRGQKANPLAVLAQLLSCLQQTPTLEAGLAAYAQAGKLHT